MKLAIIIAAYDCAEYILDCVSSIEKQIKVGAYIYDMRIGVDGCEKTAKTLKRHNIPFYWSEKNFGAYIMRNSLIYLDKADIYSYFDADDIMGNLYICQTILSFGFGAHAVMLGKSQVDQNLNMMKRQNIIDDGGAISFDQYALDKVGGFQPYRCAGDTDFMRRLNMAGIDIHQVWEPFYFRRHHNKSVTKSGQTAFGGEYRKKVWHEMCEQRKQGIIKIKPEIVQLEKR
jgi:glycosyltransferase involved in cell wall biosynthesis